MTSFATMFSIVQDSKLKNITVCMPEDRNLFNKIFGGYIMRLAFELAWANASVYTKQIPFIKHMDDILFRNPVPVGCLLYMSSQVKKCIKFDCSSGT